MHVPNAIAVRLPNSYSYKVLRRNWRALLLWPILGLALGVMLWLFTYATLEAERHDIEAKGLNDAAALSKAYAIYLDRAIEHIDQLTLYIKHDWETSGRVKLEEFRPKGLFNSKYSTALSIFDRNGAPVTSTAAFDRNQTVEDRSYFQVHRANSSDELLIGGPIVGKITGKTAIPLTRRLSAADGSFAGVVLAGVEPEFFFLAAPDILLGRTGMLAVASADGTLRLARLGKSDVQAGQSLLIKVPKLNAPALLDGQQWFSDGRNRYVASQPLAAYPFFAIVGLDQQEVLSPYEEMRARYQRMATAISFLLFLFAAIATLLSVRLASKKERLEAISSTYRLATEGAKEGFYMWEAIRDKSGQAIDFKVVDCNQRGADLFKMTKENLLDKKLSDLAIPESSFQPILEKFRHALENGFYEDNVRVLSTGSLAAEWLHRQIVRSGDGLALTLRDTTEQKRHEEELIRLATRDTLTDLPNMYWLRNHLPEALERASKNRSLLAILFLDIDDFKDINNALGHFAGSQLLQEMGTRLQTVMRHGDHVVRRPGGAFCVVLGSVANRSTVINAAHCIMLAMQQPFESIKRRKAVTASIGISVYPDDGLTAEELIKHAEIAMYAAKSECRGRFRFYEQRLYDRIQRRLDMEQGMLRGIAERHFTMYYQPRVDTLSGRLVGMEALVRWHHPERGLVQPNDFIPLAEANGLIVSLGELVMEKVCVELASWRQRHLPVVPVSVNVSARQFDEGNVKELVSRCLTKHCIPPGLLELELTESAMMGDFDTVQRQVNEITALGVKIHIDDFGTGYSSLSLLHRLNMHVLKVDRAFTAQLGSGRDGQVFFTAIMSMAKALGMSVVAEGVETEEQLGILQSLECDEIQGYFISPPRPAEDIPALLNKQVLLSEAHQWSCI